MSSASQGIRLCDQCNHTLSEPLSLRSPEHAAILSQLRAHHIPTDSESKNIARILLEVEAHLGSYDGEIDRLEAALGKLRAQRAHLQKDADACRSFQAPIRRLPSELLGEVFAHCQPSWPEKNPQDDHGDTDSRVGSRATLTLGLVCARWRDVILSSTEMWSTIIVYVHTDIGVNDRVGYQKFLAVKDILNLYMQRSGNVALSISVLSRSDSTFKASPVFKDTRGKAFFNTLTSQAYRWRRARIILDDDQLVPFWSNIQGNLWELEKLSIQNIAHVDSLSRIITIAPNLHTLTLYNYFEEDFGEHSTTFPWDRIRVLRCDGAYVDFIPAAKRCSQITHLEVNTSLSNHRGMVAELHSDSLESLSLQTNTWMLLRAGAADVNDLARFLGLLTLPSLKSLTIGLPSTFTEPEDYTQNVWPLESFTSFLSRSSCSLDTLSLENIKIKEVDLEKMLALIPTLTTLKIHEIPVQEDEPCPLVTDALLRSLTHSPDTSNATLLLPRLTHIELKAAPFFTDQVLLDMIESRWQPHSLYSHGSDGVACLDLVAVSYMNRTLDSESTCLLRLRAMNKQGLKTMLS